MTPKKGIASAMSHTDTPGGGGEVGWTGAGEHRPAGEDASVQPPRAAAGAALLTGPRAAPAAALAAAARRLAAPAAAAPRRPAAARAPMGMRDSTRTGVGR
jgi:hypothetical protein